jgi:two-component system cell cycle response regulator
MMPEKPPQGLAPLNTLVTAPSAIAPRRRAVLTILTGNETGRILPLTGGLSLTLGRRENSSHRIDDVSVSGLHARIVGMNDDYLIADQGSTNGTFVNGARVTEAAPLSDGDRIQLGHVVLRFARVDEAEEQALQRMYDAALRDGLTGVFNRKHLDERLEAEIAFARRHAGHALSIMIFDVDHFKRVNDAYGHLAGDAVLKCIAGTLLRGVRTEDVVARYGGEEFVVVVRDARVSDACIIAERLHQAIGQARVTHSGAEIAVTASAGVASLDCCGQERTRLGLIGMADKRLYVAKQAGRDRVVGP